MTRKGSAMHNEDQFARQIEAMQQRVAALFQCVSESSLQQSELLPEAFEELHISLEELRVAEEELCQQNEELAVTRQSVEVERQRYQDLFEFAPDGYLVTTAEGAIREANRAAAMLLNTSQEFLMGKQLLTFILVSERRAFRSKLLRLHQRAETSCKQKLSGGVFWGRLQEWQVRLQPRKNESFEAALAVTPICNREGKLVGLRWLLRDVTEHKQMEVEIRNALKAEKELSELKSRFISTISHEFRTPLTVILNSVQLLERYGHRRPEEERLKYLHRIQAASKNIAQLVDDVLVIGGAEAGKQQCNPAPLDLPEFCHDLVEEMQFSAGSNHVVAFASRGECPNACMDKKLLQHIFTNLLSNAIKYSPQGGMVHFELACQDGTAIFQVQDKGIGISPEDQQQLFETFHRGSNVGTIPGIGLGLAIVKKSVDLHGGKITAASEVGVGTTFTIVISLNNPLHCKRL